MKDEKLDLKEVGIMDAPNCSCLFRLDEESKSVRIGKIVYKKRDVKILSDEEGKVYIYLNGEVHSRLSQDLYEQAKKLINVWFAGIEEVWITEEKNHPIIFVNKPMAIIIAPRFEETGKKEK